MIRNFLLLGMMLAGGLASANSPLTRTETVILQSKVAVRPEDLPEAVKSALASEGYADWKIASAYLVTRDNNSQYYELNLKRGEESATLNVDKHGKKVD